MKNFIYAILDLLPSIVVISLFTLLTNLFITTLPDWNDYSIFNTGLFLTVFSHLYIIVFGLGNLIAMVSNLIRGIKMTADYQLILSGCCLIYLLFAY